MTQKHTKQQYQAYIALIFHVDGLMSNNVGLLARVVEVSLPTTATSYQFFYNGLMMPTMLAKERNLPIERVEILNCFKTRPEAQECCDQYLQAIKEATRLNQIALS